MVSIVGVHLLSIDFPDPYLYLNSICIYNPLNKAYYSTYRWTDQLRDTISIYLYINLSIYLSIYLTVLYITKSYSILGGGAIYPDQRLIDY